MKAETLKTYFQRSRRAKLYIDTEDYLLAGWVSNPQEKENSGSLFVDLGPYIVYSYATERILKSTVAYNGFEIHPALRMTRKIQTHRRHAKKFSEDYFRRAWEL